ncbi:hypothetical protein [Parasphingorhabdus cellanae]|uniref:Uncharacterized protein n=1 Tax=Parasphingorhabdus cellanae TaxID=2806553 RepID=A0ABX7T5U2_9SPHN|nr:hypothetical protein [Parasphingorhabdus cellanae]QTD56137.1 hypothetical protein J4G78_00570 [Parasphingorhabdus cellanae]
MLPPNAAEVGTDAPGRGRLSRKMLIRKYRLVDGGPPMTRAARFANRFMDNDDRMSFADLAALPLWSADPNADRQELSYAAGLLCFRPQLDQELDGIALRTVTDGVGEQLFDRIMEAPRPTTSNIMPLDQPLPTPDEISRCGAALMDRAARSCSDDRAADVPCSAVTSQEARAICDLAYQLIETAPVPSDAERD